MKTLIIGLALAAAAWSQCASPYGYQRSITVNSGQVTGTLTNFTRTVSGADFGTSLKTVANGGRLTSANGYDVIFVNTGGTPLAFELVGHGGASTTYSATTGAAEFHVLVASEAVGSVIYACYGAASVTTYQGSDATAWNSNYTLAAHMPNGTTLSTTDSKQGFTFTATGTPTAAAGQIDGAVNFTAASSQYIQTAHNLMSPAMSITAWIKPASFPNSYNAVADNSADFFDIFVKSNGKLAMYTTPDHGSTLIDYDGTGSHTLSSGTWYHVAMTYDSTSGLVGYVNGSVDGTAAAAGTLTTTATVFSIGSDPPTFTTRYFDGAIDEVHVSNVAISAAWVAAEYNNGVSTTGYYTVGSEVPLAGTSMSASPTNIPSGTAGQVITLTGTGTSWVNGTTIFTVTGATKTAQSVSSNTAATVTVTTTSSGTMTVTETVTGSTSANVTVYSIFTTNINGTSPTQAILSYNHAGSCTIEVSESPTCATIGGSCSPLIHDVDSTLFTGANTDTSRTDAIINGSFKLVPIGLRAVATALDGHNYSRALQAYTATYGRTTCGSDISTYSFTTRNIPAGNTAPEPPQADTGGAWKTPYLDGTRNQKVVDPFTGALLSPVSIPADHAGPSSYGLFIGDGGGTVHCNNTLQTAPTTGAIGYLCVLWQENQGWGTLYFVNHDTGEVICLGLLHWSNPSIDSNMDLYCTGASSGDCFGGSTPGVTYLRHYQGNFTTQTDADLASPVVYNSTSVGTLMHNFDSSFDVTLFGCSGISGGVGIYRAVECKRGNQNSFGWEGVFYTGDGRAPVPSSCSVGDSGCPRIVAASYTFVQPQTKFCGIHNTQLFQGQSFIPPVNTNMLLVNWHDLDNGSANDGTAFIGANTVGSVMAGSTTITVDGPVHSFASGGELATIPAVAPGDVFHIAGIGFDYTLVSNVSNVWTFTPALSDPVSNGTLVFMFCNSPRSTADGDWSISGWDFLTYPSGSTVVFDRTFPGGGHYGLGPLGRTTETSGGEGFYPFNGGSLASSLNTAGVEIDSTATWNGVTTPGYGALLTKHPSYQNYTAAAQWFNDRMTFAGQPTDGSVVAYSDWPVGASVPISGTGGVLYKYTSAPLYPLDRKNVATQASTGGKSLLDISSPATGNVISPDAVDNYKYCVVLKAGECRSGSSAGDIFFNVPTALAFTVCTGGDAPNPLNIDACITNTPVYSGSLMQWGMGFNSPNSQSLSRNMTLGMAGVKDTFGFPVAKPTALGEFTMFTVGLGINNTPDYMDVWKVKMPPVPIDSVNRTQFAQVKVIVPASSADNVIVEFGYDTNFYCSSRAEACYAGTTVSPYAYPVDGSGAVLAGLTGTSCGSGCTVSVPAISGKLLYSRVISRNASNVVLTTGPTSVQIVP